MVIREKGTGKDDMWTVMDRVTARGLVNLYPAVKAVPRAKLHISYRWFA